MSVFVFLMSVVLVVVLAFALACSRNMRVIVLACVRARVSVQVRVSVSVCESETARGCVVVPDQLQLHSSDAAVVVAVVVTVRAVLSTFADHLPHACAPQPHNHKIKTQSNTMKQSITHSFNNKELLTLAVG